jgi:hypothetical protein
MSCTEPDSERGRLRQANAEPSERRRQAHAGFGWCPKRLDLRSMPESRGGQSFA